MPRGDKSSYTDKQKRKAEHIGESYEKRGVSKKEAESRAWATVNKKDKGGIPHADVRPLKVENDSLSDEQVLFLSDIFPTGYMAAENAEIEPGDTVAIWGNLSRQEGRLHQGGPEA